jgi:hypothetical protein
MRDIGGFVLLALALFGALKGRGLPYMVPQLLIVLSVLLLIYRGFFMKSKLSFVYTAAGWTSLVWIAGKSMEETLGNGLIMQAPFFLLLMTIPMMAYLHQRIYHRFNPITTKGLELEPPETTLGFITRIKSYFQPEKKADMELIVFDLGREVKHRSK